MLEVRLLGQFSLRRDHAVVLLPSRPAQSLLAYLALNAGAAHRREKLAGLFWPDAEEENARSNLRHALWRIRKAIEPDPAATSYLLSDEFAVSFNAGAVYWLDAAILTRSGNTPQELIESVTVYKGELLPGIYDDWVTLERQRLEALFHDKMQRLLDRLVEDRNWANVLEWGERWVALGHAPEPGYRALMLAHGELGDRSRVAAVYQRCREALFNELGVDPSPATQRLYERLCRGETVPPTSSVAASTPYDDAPARGEPPYQGLRYFDEADAERFFGREALTARLLGRLEMEPFLAVLGTSGSGKSSVVRAGLVAGLRRLRPAIDVRVLTPTAHPLGALARSLAPDAERGTLVEELGRDPGGLRRYLQRHVVRGRRVVLIIDQFEELFTLCIDAFEREAFVENLLGATEADASAQVVIALRADFYTHCADYPRLRDAVAQHQEYVGALSLAELRLAIEGPAEGGGWEFEPGLIDLLLRDVGEEPGALPLLSHALLEIWHRRRGRQLTLASYAAAGGVQGAIAQTADAVFSDQLPPEAQAIARRVFLRLVELGEGTQDTRRRAALDELIRSPDESPATRAVLAVLADARLVMLGEDTAEVAHEALIREWPRLREWLTEDRANLRIQRQLDRAAEEWDRLAQDPGALYRGTRLSHALDWASEHEDEVHGVSGAFLNASVEAADLEATQRERQRQREVEAAQELARTERRAARQLRQRALLLAAAFVVALAMAGLALFSADQARENALVAQANSARAEAERLTASARELAAAAIANLDVDPERSLLLALQATNLTYTVDGTTTLEADNALHRAIFASRARLTIAAGAGPVWGMALSPDGSRIATANQDQTARIWNATTGEELMTLRGHSDAVNGVAFSPDGALLASASDDGTARVWDATTGQEILTLRGQGPVIRAVFSPDGKRLAMPDRVWDLATGREVLTLSHQDFLFGVAFSPDGTRLATTGYERAARIWDAATGEALLTLTGHEDSLRNVAFSPDGTNVATASFDGSAKVWDTRTGSLLLNYLGHTNPVQAIAFSPDGTRVATAGFDKAVKIWNASTGRELLTLHGHTDLITDVAFSPDGKRLVSASLDGTARVWDLLPAHELLAIPLAGGANGVAFNPDGARLAAAGRAGATVWNASDGNNLATIGGKWGPASQAAFSSDGRLLAIGSIDGTATVFDVVDGSELQHLSGHTGAVVGIAFGPDSTLLATAGEDQTARVWDWRSGRQMLSFSTQPNLPMGLAFSPDGRHIATAATPGFGHLAESLDQPTAIVWDAATGGAIVNLRGNLRVNALAFSPDGTRLATVQGDGTIKLWDAASGGNLFTLEGHTSAVVGVTFSPDGTLLATASRDGVAKLWSSSTGEEILGLVSDGSPLTGVAFSPDGRQLATAGDFGIRTYSLRAVDLMELARTRLTRSWRPEECQAFLHLNQCPQ